MLTLLKWIFPLLFGLAALGQLQRIELSAGRAIYLHEIVMLIVVTMALKHFRPKGTTLFKAFLAFVVWVMISIVLLGISQAPIISPSLYLLRFLLYSLFGYALWFVIQAHWIDKSTIWKFFVGSIFVIALLGWLQYFLIPDTRALAFLGWDNHYFRLISTLFDPGFTGAVLVLGSIALQQRLFSWEKRTDFRFALFQWLWLIITGALLFTYSRASFVAYAVGTCYLYLRERKVAHLVALGFFAFAILLLPRPRSEGARLERTASIIARVETWEAARPLSLSRLFLGMGWYSQKQETQRLMAGNQIVNHSSAPDNSFIFVLTSLGVIGLLFYLWLGKQVLSFSRNNILAIAAIISMSAHALFSNTLFYPFVMFYLAVLIAVS